MPAFNAISADKLARLTGTPNAPIVIDVRTEDAFTEAPVLVPASLRRSEDRIGDWASSVGERGVVIVCGDGGALSHGVAALLRGHGHRAEILEGGLAAWIRAGLPAVPEAKLPRRDHRGRTVWVTRARPKIDRIACPWLIRRFVDPLAMVLFVPAAEVAGVAERFAAAPFDIDDPAAIWSHRGPACTFDVMIEELGLATEPLLRLATIVRGADTARPDLAPEVAGLLAVSLGLSRMYGDDLAQLDAGMLIYDAFYRWCRDAVGETHDWPTARKTRD
ncbi:MULTISPECIES: sulfurtransferase/chromate resistance protein [Methylobacterium]|uniref:Rhodanese domain-containing protein n=4 Tax=Pseudomonadota TaxID=1224 RepID=A0ABQ4SXA3_9HYPH|nr:MULTISPECIES: sulfurtransferase/chromate resistance protein [Methylobacterium]PIU06376.1 MAG: sulfurtransferase [Methylobacterium sp. CG09_land_8_20_14_0_10_71_15]PIU14572.1 MAG: sulfurtransferase [Methylobacterium sp. CG08_land_8_20_14_0_20_71_15]GJE07492.1 hypothetical protein AOPFMNJM_2821 [Methylobacterium jeotgali]